MVSSLSAAVQATNFTGAASLALVLTWGEALHSDYMDAVKHVTDATDDILQIVADHISKQKKSCR